MTNLYTNANVAQKKKKKTLMHIELVLGFGLEPYIGITTRHLCLVMGYARIIISSDLVSNKIEFNFN